MPYLQPLETQVFQMEEHHLALALCATLGIVKPKCTDAMRRPSVGYGTGVSETGIWEILEHGSDRHETLPKRVSSDSGRFVFRRRKKLFGENFGSKISFFANLAWILTSYGETDVKISFWLNFRFR